MKINVTRSSLPSFDEYCNEIKDLWESRWLTNMGIKHKKLEKELISYLEVPNVTLFTNGHLALEAAIAAFDFPKNSEVITTPFSFVSTSNAIVRNGLVPVFCDIKKNDYTLDPDKIEALISERTVAIVPVHVYGNVCDIEKIERIAKKHNLRVIYDAAHAFGVKYKGVNCATFGDVSMFSFHATKVFNTIEGGAVCYNDSTLTQKFNDIKNFGIRGEERCASFGANAKMNEFQAAMGLCNLRHIEENIKKRGEIVSLYKKRLSNVEGIVLCDEQSSVEPNYAYFPVVFLGYKYSRDQIKERLANNDIGARKYFYPCINDYECYAEYNKNPTPIAKEISNLVLTLPLFPELTEKDINLICDIILK